MNFCDPVRLTKSNSLRLFVREEKMTSSKKVLFISAPIGSGHIQAAQAVAATLKAIAPDIAVEHANVFDFFPPAIGKAVLNIYLKLLKVFPRAYGSMYDWGNTSSFAVAGRELISTYLANRMNKYIKEINPALIVCTHATPAGLAARLVRTGDFAAPVLAIVTDYTVHRLWIYPEISQYFVADESLGNYLLTHDIRLDRYQVTGIPVNNGFVDGVRDRQTVLTSYGLSDNIATILLMGGGTGLLPMIEIIKTLETLEVSLQIIAVAGNNPPLHRALNKLATTLSFCKLIPLGFVTNVNELMAISHILVSKPGGMTCAEALASGLPLIIYQPIPGQEEANTRFLVLKSAAWRAESLSELRAIIAEVVTQTSDKLTAVKAKAEALGRPDAAKKIASYIIDVLQ
jgi:processive 1,2-diacylglycerol beta-glucosyltransferase